MNKFIVIDTDGPDGPIIRKIFDTEQDAIDYYDMMSDKRQNSFIERSQYVENYVNELVKLNHLETYNDLTQYLKANSLFKAENYDFGWTLKEFKTYLTYNMSSDALLENFNPPKLFNMGMLYIRELKEENE